MARSGRAHPSVASSPRTRPHLRPRVSHHPVTPMRRSPYSHRAPAPLSLRARAATLKDVRLLFQSFRRTHDPVLPALHAREATRRIDDKRANQMAPRRHLVPGVPTHTYANCFQHFRYDRIPRFDSLFPPPLRADSRTTSKEISELFSESDSATNAWHLRMRAS
jgi:hypothetical protein